MSKKFEKTYYFMSGLPRSGSTVLSSILNQNPRIYSGPNSPVLSLMELIENHLLSDEKCLAYPKPLQEKELIFNVFSHYYSDVEKPVIIDKDRGWPFRLDLLSEYLGTPPKVICPVRNVDEILASCISMHRRNPFQIDGKVNFIDAGLIKNNLPLTDDVRCDFLAGANGVVGHSYNALRHALAEGGWKQLHLVEYDRLINSPEETMRSIYDFLGEEYYKHDFKKIKNLTVENDKAAYGFSDLHKVRGRLSKKSVNPSEILSEHILEKYKNAEFWRDLEGFL